MAHLVIRFYTPQLQAFILMFYIGEGHTADFLKADKVG